MARRPMGLGIQVNSATVSPFYGFEGASETYIEGALLILDSGDSNRLDEGGTDPVNIEGIAARSAIGTAATAIPYYPALPGVVFEGSLDDGSAAGTGTITASDFGASYGVTRDSGGIWYVDKNKTGADARVKIIGFRDALTTITGRVYFVFLIG